MKKILQVVGPAVLVAGTILAITAWTPEHLVPWVLPVIFPFGLIVAIAVRHGFTLPDEYLTRWTKAHGIEITDENWPAIHRYLRRGRRIRTVGALTGYMTYSVWAFGAHDSAGVSWFTATFAGYLLGAAAAEIWAFRPQPGARRAASLSPRRISDYIPPTAIVLLRVTTIAIVLLAAGWEFVPLDAVHGGISRVLRRPELAFILGWTATALVISALVEVTARRIVRRPQPITSPDLVAADDAIRSTAMHGLIGAGLTLVLGILSAGLGKWSGLAGKNVGAVFGVVGMFSGLGCLFAWLRLGVDQPWIVRRSQLQREVTA